MLNIKDLNVSVLDKKIIDDLNLNVKDGEIHVILGPNGVGKSTICKVLMGDPSYTIDSGIIEIDKEVINDMSPTNRARLGIFLLNQTPPAIEGVTNAEMLRAALTERDSKPVNILKFNKKLEGICAALDLPISFIHKNINEGASGGERKKIELMHMWMLEPKTILLDEIDSGLDVDAMKTVMMSLQKYYEIHKPTIIIITHHAKILDYLSPDYVHVLKNGTIVQSGDKNLAQEIEIKGFTKEDKANQLSESENDE